MWISGLNGRISSGNITDRLSNSGTVENVFDFTSESAYFFKDGLAIGWTLTGSGSINTGMSETSAFSLGAFTRIYFSKRRDIGALFGELSMQYVSVNSKFTTLNSAVPFNERVSGAGFGFSMSIGYTYLLMDAIGFDFKMKYDGAWLDGQRSNTISNIEAPIDTYSGKISFSFGFTVFINEFFF